MENFLNDHDLKYLIKKPTCFKNVENPSCIDHFLTNSPRSFQNSSTLSTGLSDFHKMIVTVFKCTVPKGKPKIVEFRDFRNYNEEHFLKSS